MTSITGCAPTHGSVLPIGHWAAVTRVACGADDVFATRLAFMPSKAVARSGTRTSRSKAASRGGPRSGRPAAPRRKASRPAKRRSRPMLVGAGLTCGRAVRATWLLAARGTGGAARSIGRAREIEPGHRRDGIALVLLGLSVVVAASSWFDAARPVGAWVDSVLRIFIGSTVVVLPLVTAAIALLLMRTEPNPDARPLFIGALFGLLLLTGTTIREVPDTLRSMFGTRMFDGAEAETEAFDADADVESPVTEDFSDGYYDDPSAYGDDEAQAWPSPVAADDSPTVPEPAVARGRRRGAKSAGKQDTVLLDRVVEGPYTLPSLSLLVGGGPPTPR